MSAQTSATVRQGLAHVQRGELSRAVPPLMVGLEGAFWSAGREHDVIDEERKLLAKPSKGVIRRVDYVVRGLPATQEFRTFVCSRVFGDVGHPVRHGEQSDRRRQALFAVVGIAGWVDAFMGLRARQALARLLHNELVSRRASLSANSWWHGGRNVPVPANGSSTRALPDRPRVVTVRARGTPCAWRPPHGSGR
jgi:hypothetical protein